MAKRAFTLIELLVVIVIVAILAAIVVPVLAKARERARMVQCINNLKQIGMGVSLYQEDSNGWYPDAWHEWWVGQGYRPALRQKLKLYTRDVSVFRCPSDTGEVFRHAMDTYPYPTRPFYSDNFAMSSYTYLGLGFGNDYGQVGGHPSSWVKRPSLAVLLVEPRPLHGGYDPNALYGSQSPALVNVLHCDQHVARRTWTQWTEDATEGVKP